MKPERLSRNTVYQSPWVNLYLDHVKFPNGHVIDEFHLLDFSHEAVAAIVEDETGNIKGIRFSTLEAICKTLDCQPGDILEHIPDSIDDRKSKI